MLTALLPLAGWAETKPGANTVFTFNWTHEGDSKTAVITGFVNGATKGAITIPATVAFPEADGAEPSTFNVIEIAANAFEGETAITSVDFAASSNLTTIGEDAFLGCTGMTSVNFTNATKLTTIAARAFKGTKITALDLSATKLAAVTNILGTNYTDDPAVSNNTLTTVVLPATVTGIAGGAFANCTALATFTINGSTAGFTIGASAFRGTAIETLDLEKTTLVEVENLFGTVYAGANSINNNKLKTVKLPKTWETIATKAFENCTALSTISLKPAAEITALTQAIASLAFNGTALTTLNFTGTKVTGIPEKLLMDGTNVKKNTTLQTVTLNATIVDLNASFANCEALATVIIPDNSTLTALEANEFKGDKALATINTSKITTFGGSAFEGCAALESIKLDAAINLGVATFKDAGLTIVTIPKTVTTIPDNCFNGCEKLETVNFGHGDADAFNRIGEYAFAYTKIAAIIIPKTLPLDEADGIKSKAFGGCEQLKSFTFKPEGEPTATVINVNAFLGCSGVMFYTTDDYMGNPNVSGANQPKNITYVTSATPAVVTSFTTTKFANGENKYYIKWKGANDIKIKKNEAKVYDAYLDDEWNTLNMIQFKSSGGYVYIKAGQVALIITEKEDLSYEASDAGKHTSWISFTDAEHNDQVLQILGADKSRLDLEEEALAGSSIYGWVNSANTKKTGFQKITSGKTFKKGTLYVYAKEEPAAAPGLNVVWLDENGFVEENTTAISDIIAEPAQENGEMFNLQGIRVNGAAQKGIYIKNGKKFVVK